VRKEQGNNTSLAYQLPVSTPTTRTQTRPRRVIKGLPSSEKMLYLVSTIICIMAAIFVMTRYAELTQLDVSIQQTETKINHIKEVNTQLDSEKTKQSSLEQIREFAEQNGLQIIPSIHP
jgi:cell division protein FtsL